MFFSILYVVIHCFPGASHGSESPLCPGQYESAGRMARAGAHGPIRLPSTPVPACNVGKTLDPQVLDPTGPSQSCGCEGLSGVLFQAEWGHSGVTSLPKSCLQSAWGIPQLLAGSTL